MSGSHLCNPRNETVPVPTLKYLREIYIFPGSVCLFCCSQICGLILGIYKSLTDTLMGVGLRPPIPRKGKGIHKWDFRCSVVVAWLISQLGVQQVHFFTG
jgi:hypothetical protein